MKYSIVCTFLSSSCCVWIYILVVSHFLLSSLTPFNIRSIPGPLRILAKHLVSDSNNFGKPGYVPNDIFSKFVFKPQVYREIPIFSSLPNNLIINDSSYYVEHIAGNNFAWGWCSGAGMPCQINIVFNHNFQSQSETIHIWNIISFYILFACVYRIYNCL